MRAEEDPARPDSPVSFCMTAPKGTSSCKRNSTKRSPRPFPLIFLPRNVLCRSQTASQRAPSKPHLAVASPLSQWPPPPTPSAASSSFQAQNMSAQACPLNARPHQPARATQQRDEPSAATQRACAMPAPRPAPPMAAPSSAAPSQTRGAA